MLEHGIENISAAEREGQQSVSEASATYHPDIIIVEAFGQIIPRAISDMLRYGCVDIARVNCFRKYPRCRTDPAGGHNGDAVTGVTTMRMDEDLIPRYDLKGRSEDPCG